METTSVVHGQKKAFRRRKENLFPFFCNYLWDKWRKPEVSESAVCVQHMFMYTISFSEKQGLLFLNTPRDIRHREDAWRRIQRVGTHFHVWHRVCWAGEIFVINVTGLRWGYLVINAARDQKGNDEECWSSGNSPTSQAVWCFLKWKAIQHFTQKKMLFLLH